MARRRRFGLVRKLPSGRWQASFIGPAGKRQAAPHTFATRADADRWLAAVELDLSRGTWVDERAASVPFLDYAEQWLNDNRRLAPDRERLMSETCVCTSHRSRLCRSVR